MVPQHYVYPYISFQKAHRHPSLAKSLLKTMALNTHTHVDSHAVSQYSHFHLSTARCRV